MSDFAVMFFSCGVVIIVAVFVTSIAIGWRQSWYKEFENRINQLEADQYNDLDDLPVRDGKRAANGD